MAALLGKKIGMTQVFQEDGRVERVTVVEAGPCHVTAIRSHDRDGYYRSLELFATEGLNRAAVHNTRMR